MVLLCVTIVILFIPLLIMLLQVDRIPKTLIPVEFNLASLALVGSSMFLFNMESLIKMEQIRKIKYKLSSAVLLGVVFLSFQYAGCMQLYFSAIDTKARIISVIVATHAIHLIAGILIILTKLIPILKISSGAEAYIYFMDDHKVRALKNYHIYWNFMTVVWMVFFLVILLKSW